MSDADTDVLLEELRDELSQGDILEFCPVGAVAELKATRIFNGEDTRAQARALVFRHPLDLADTTVKNPPAPALFKRADGGHELVLFEARLRRCVVVSNDCVALAKAANKGVTFAVTKKVKESPWHVAPLDPWPAPTEMVTLEKGVQRPKGELIAEGRFHRLLEIPEGRAKNGTLVLDRGVVDLTYLTPLKPQVFTSAVRIASMSDLGVAVLSAKVFTYFSGLTVPTSLRCPGCSAAFRLDDLLKHQQKPSKPPEGVAAAPTDTPPSQ